MSLIKHNGIRVSILGRAPTSMLLPGTELGAFCISCARLFLMDTKQARIHDSRISIGVCEPKYLALLHDIMAQVVRYVEKNSFYLIQHVELDELDRDKLLVTACMTGGESHLFSYHKFKRTLTFVKREEE